MQTTLKCMPNSNILYSSDSLNQEFFTLARNMPTTKLVTVFGATGLQGGSVVLSLISNKEHQFAVRGITRNPESENAKALSALGVEMVKVDGSKLDEIKEAFRGSWSVFINTDSESPVSIQLQVRLPGKGSNLAHRPITHQEGPRSPTLAKP